MGLSIQDYLKKINSWLTFPDIVSLFITFTFFAVCVGYIFHMRQENTHSVIYKESSLESDLSTRTKNQPHVNDIRPFGSSKGKTYTFSWCQGSARISAKNKIYFVSATEAETSGRTLSKLCRK